jgi:hypothetical protein
MCSAAAAAAADLLLAVVMLLRRTVAPTITARNSDGNSQPDKSMTGNANTIVVLHQIKVLHFTL